MTAEDLAGEVDRYRVYSRIDPLDKVKIVEAWRQRGRSCHDRGRGERRPRPDAADVGWHGSGTDVAKGRLRHGAHDDNFASIVSAVREGRGIFPPEDRVYFLLSCHFSEVLVMFWGFWSSGPWRPLLAVQLLWVNLVTDGLPALALGMDPPAPNVMLGPPDAAGNPQRPRRQLMLLRRRHRAHRGHPGALILGH